MKKTKTVSRLSLDKQNIRVLSAREIESAAGGMRRTGGGCPDSCAADSELKCFPTEK